MFTRHSSVRSPGSNDQQFPEFDSKAAAAGETASRRHSSRHHPHRRICLAARRQLAGGFPRSRRCSIRRSATHLEAENAYQRALMDDTAELQKVAVPGDEGAHQGRQFLGADEGRAVRLRLGLPESAASSRAIFRTPRDGGPEDIILDGDVEADGKPYFTLGDVDHSPDHRKLLWAYDDKGSEFYHADRPRALDGRVDHDDIVTDTGGVGRVERGQSTASSTPGSTHNHRPSKIFYPPARHGRRSKTGWSTRRPIPASS